ncbi:NADP-dependent oxidoreductase domain-containing protein [Lipomyces arxii]|uniref:NADP-dependent oxidoreductase domain-containing protein n=1 Tax=Lipomyces arxii TaxID=56418 RepID=UPI0034CFAD37
MAKYTKLGNTGLRVSNPILGFMSYGSPTWSSWVKPAEEALPIIKAAYDMGVTTWDTANAYSCGVSEKIVALALKEYKIPRNEIVIMTKCFFPVEPEGTAQDMDLTVTRARANSMGLSRAAIFNQVEASLARLQTDYIDVLQIHRYDYNVSPEEVMCALNDLVRSGKVRYIGASSMYTYQFATLQHTAEKNGWTKFVSMQNHYNILYREEEREMIPFCKQTGVGIIPWSPLAQGGVCRPVKKDGETAELTEREKAYQVRKGPRIPRLQDVPSNQVVISRVEEIAKKHGWSMSEVALAWINGKVSSPIIGANSIARLEEAISASYKSLTDEEIKYLEEPYLPSHVIGNF